MPWGAQPRLGGLEPHAERLRQIADGQFVVVVHQEGCLLYTSVPELKDRLELKDLPEEDRGRYNTLAGMIMLLLGRLPRTADAVVWEGWRFEVVDLDGKRVDKVMVTRTEPPGEET